MTPATTLTTTTITDRGLSREQVATEQARIIAQRRRERRNDSLPLLDVEEAARMEGRL